MEKDLEGFRPEENMETEDFATLLDSGFSGPFRYLSVGDRIQATIVGIGNDSLLMDVGQRSEGSIPTDEFTEDELMDLRIGDVLEVYVAQVTRGIRLSRGMRGRSLDLEALKDAAKAGIPVEGKVSGENKGGYEVDLPGARGFVPHSQIDIGVRQQPSEYIGKTFKFRILEIKGKDVVLSRAALLKEEQAAQRDQLMAELKDGQIRSATVIKHEDFGAFVDLGGGVNALIPRSEISWTRGDDPTQLLPVGQTVSVMITRVETRDGRPRVSASLRQLAEDPWNSVTDEFAVGRTVKGKVVRMMPFGAFLELAPGVEGLLHISEMSAEKRLRSPGELLKLGDEVDVSVTVFDPAQRKISLSMKALAVKEDDIDVATRARYMPSSKQPAGETVLAMALRLAQEKAKK